MNQSQTLHITVFLPRAIRSPSRPNQRHAVVIRFYKYIFRFSTLPACNKSLFACLQFQLKICPNEREIPKSWLHSASSCPPCFVHVFVPSRWQDLITSITVHPLWVSSSLPIHQAHAHAHHQKKMCAIATYLLNFQQCTCTSAALPSTLAFCASSFIRFLASQASSFAVL